MKFRAVALSLFFFLTVSAPAGVLARFDMKQLGIIDVELFELDKPVTVSNFVAYVKAGVWHDNVMHRWVENFVIQGGSYSVPFSPTNSPLAVNPQPIQTFPAITNEYSVGRPISNTYGTLAMARIGGQTNSATSSWFFNVNDNSFLDDVDGGFTVFGRTLRGTNILDRFTHPDTTTNIYLLFNGAGQKTSWPAYSPDDMKAFWLNVDITLLTAKIVAFGGGVQISWKSVEGRANIVEYSTTVPEVWQTLQTVAGTGATLTAIDGIGDPVRHYRVRVDYSN
jgi:cyclophilin family peptidyl-prolyl cis-trans isomerase